MKKFVVMILTFILFFIPSVSIQAESIEVPPEVTAEGAVVLDINSGQILYAKNENQQFFPASITKVLTTIVALEHGHLNDIVTVSKNATMQEGSSVYLQEGEKVTLEQLLHGLMMYSGNDAAMAIAEHIGGSQEGFINLMNETAKKTGAVNSVFKNPHGLPNDEHKVTAKDMAFITAYAMKNPDFRRIAGTKEYFWEGKNWKGKIYTKHKLLKGEIQTIGVSSGKTGYTTAAKHTLITTAANEGTEIAVIILKEDQKGECYLETKRLIEYTFRNFKTCQLTKKEDSALQYIQDDQKKLSDWIVKEDTYYTFTRNQFEAIEKTGKNIEESVTYQTTVSNQQRRGKLQILLNNQKIKEALIENPKQQSQADKKISTEMQSPKNIKSFFKNFNLNTLKTTVPNKVLYYITIAGLGLVGALIIKLFFGKRKNGNPYL